MGFWGVPSEIIIGDEFADVVDRHIEAAAEELVQKYPYADKAQFLATIKFCCQHVQAFDARLPEGAVTKRNEILEQTAWQPRRTILDRLIKQYGTVPASHSVPEPTSPGRLRSPD